jgi:hypothetical protein
MPLSDSTHLVTSELVDSSFAQVLHASGPDKDLAEKLEIYGWIVGPRAGRDVPSADY